MTDYRQELSIIRQALLRARDCLHRIQYEGLVVQIKPDGSPVTNADLEVNRIVQEALFAVYPDDGWLSEESPDNPIRLKKNRVWILDPIDGTKPFIKNLPQFAISLALIDHGQASIGIIFNPATQEYYCAVRGEPATVNGYPIHVGQTTGHRLSFLVNTGPIDRSTIRTWGETAHCRNLMGSIAYSLALVAAGQIDGVINIGTQNEWDIAAALLLVQAAGGVVLDRDLKPIQCNQPHPIVNGIIAARPDALPVIQQLLGSLPG
ncbi:inositol monophosphatase family protein [Candidatus Nitrospira allomarina]|uniref:3'(2'),5'-bisphosphate nucleotidase CysQ n=1 Tax=Candidatus Nitrospira allomarina TaxID=3020900 RepID=A0AA96JTN0_9BACT|nr:3'(2'),5'-bisphosphate nucleotidase CysQ [Candidatus Nitrospira allomarina]WNM59742.1 3'(2'),5'-bisphosphate nucleotidase CysQ [Candidatus Nitrospira allomarina]